VTNASATSVTPSRTMFWRIVRRLITANRGRLFVVLLALAAGAAITAALLNLQIDAKRRLTTEFRDFGPSVIITPRPSEFGSALGQTMPEHAVPSNADGPNLQPFLYVSANVSGNSGQSVQAVIVGTSAAGVVQVLLTSSLRVEAPAAEFGRSTCIVGSEVLSHLRLSGMPRLSIMVGERSLPCQTSSTFTSGGPEDNEIFLDLSEVQNLAAAPGRISLMQANVPGSPKTVQNYIDTLQKQAPGVNVHGVRQFSEAQGKIYAKISGLLTATVVLVLILTALCVMAAMTNVAMERRNDVGLMKAIGGATRRVLRLFLAEAALLGLAGGLMGAAIGIALSIGLGKAVFGIAARPRFIVYPISVGLTILVAIASSYPLRRLASIRPASVFRGEA
jgi:putative ABC transport system permease protein